MYIVKISSLTKHKLNWFYPVDFSLNWDDRIRKKKESRFKAKTFNDTRRFTK